MAACWWHLYVELSVVFSVSGDQCRTGHVVAPLASLFVCPASIGVPPFATSSQGEEFLHDRCKQEGGTQPRAARSFCPFSWLLLLL